MHSSRARICTDLLNLYCLSNFICINYTPIVGTVGNTNRNVINLPGKYFQLFDKV